VKRRLELRACRMTEREDKVYQAKLAEQAERYDGKKRIFLHTQMRFVGEKMGVGVRIVLTGAYIDLLCFPVLVEKYLLYKYIDVHLIKVVRI
jgi:hypothetical protein